MLALILPWLLNGGWRWLAGGFVAIAIGIFALSAIHHYRDLEAAAARVPALEESIKGKDALLDAMKKADADRAEADAKLSTWQAAKGQILSAIRTGMNNAPIEVNPVCQPTADDRMRRNQALDKLLPAPAVPAQ